jgi:DNA-binding MarR family transcriptional regulator
MSDKYIVKLRDDERQELVELTKKGTATARRILRAHILLLADEDKPDMLIAATLHTSLSTIGRTRQRFVAGNLAGALNDKPHPKRGSKLDGKGRALLVATACSTPPEGHAKWTMQLLATRLIELKVVETISDETVRQELKKTS